MKSWWKLSKTARSIITIITTAMLVVGIGETAACSSSEEPKWGVWKVDDLATIDRAGDLSDFTTANWGRNFPSSPELAFMKDPIRASLEDTICGYDRDPDGTTTQFKCEMNPRANVHPGCLLVWTLNPTFEAKSATTLANVFQRIHVVDKFDGSGYGYFNPRRVPDPEFVGVTSVKCDETKTPADEVGAPLRVSFALCKEDQISQYGSLFRTIGFDWLAQEHFTKPYVAELFALAALYHITQAIYSKTSAFPRLVTRHEDELFTAKQLGAFRSRKSDDIWVMNRSDGQLGNSRGSCLLAADSAAIPDTVGRYAAPSAFINTSYPADRSLVLTGDRVLSIPCVLISALVTRDMSAVKDYPTRFTGEKVEYYVLTGEKDERNAIRRGYYLRATALTLYTLGFRVTYDESTESKAAQVQGFWPRNEFLQSSSPLLPGSK